MSEWQTRTLEELAEIYDGPHATPAKIETGPWFLSISSLDNGRLRLEESAHLSEEDYEKWTRRVTPAANDVLFSYETRLGDAALMPTGIRACLGRRMGLLRARSSVADPRFLLYAYLGPEFQATIQQRKIPGATVDRIPLVQMGKWSMRVPGLGDQRAIAAVLGALDDKIAVNERIAATALELADAQFCDAVSTVSLSSQTFGSIAEVAGGGTPSTKVDSYWGGHLPWATPSDVTALSVPYLFGTSRMITQSGLENCASRLYPAMSIFMTSRATIGDFALPQVPTAVNQGFIVVLPPTDELRWWLLHEMRSRVAEMISISNGSTFLELSRKNFKEMRVRLAAPEKLRQFSQVAASLHASAAIATAESRTLANLRDTLLPKLMSGQITVRQAESLVEDAT